ncbi:MAG: ComEC/Rec2 family competence protein [Bacteroidaceae bacterium]|nr:ComEC/Rec2 family competence protein [Bacteroidaceae bacterium]
MIVQHPMLWCAAFLMAGIAFGLYFPLPYFVPLLAVLLIACTLLRRFRHFHDILTLLIWFLLGCSRASVCCLYSQKPSWQQTVERKAQAVQTSLTTRLRRSGISPQTLALAETLVVGKRDDLSRDTKEAYRQVGASHLLALSGMHLGIIYSFLYLVFIRWTRFSKWRWHTLPFILLSLWGYALVAGMPVSLVRAALMLSILTIISLMQYQTDPLHPLALSAIIILIIDPTELLSISFQLSFVAVFFLVALWRPLGESFPKLHWSVELIAVSSVASLGTMPLVAYYFHQVTLIGPLLSLVLIPLTTAIIYLTLAAMLLPVAPLGWLLDVVVSLQQRIIDLAGSLPFATLTGVYLDATLVALIYGALLVAIIRLRTRE